MRALALNTISGWQSSLLAFVAGAILPLAFSPFYFYPIAVVSLFGLFLCWQNDTAKQAAWHGWLFGLGVFGVGVSWVFVAIHVFGHSDIFTASLLTFLFVAFLATYIAALGWIIKKLAPGSLSCWDTMLLLPVAWVCFELFKSWFLSGFPWLELGVSQIDGPLAGFVPIIGVHGVSWLIALSAAVLVMAIQKHFVRWCLLLVCMWSVGAGLNYVDWTEVDGKPIKTTIIQGNVSQEIKWDPQQLFNTMALYRQLTQQHWDSDLIVWPENAIPAFYHQLKEMYFDPLALEAAAYDTSLLIGLPVQGENEQDYFNSILALHDGQANFYHKRHLVPFGDYVPFEWLRGVIAFFNLPMSAFVPGPSSQPLLTVADTKVGTSICYEDVFSDEVMESLPEAQVLVNATNNAWYGDSFAPHQHLQISRSRALEMGRPLIRSTTNGISAFVDFKGQIVMQTPQFEQSTLTDNVQPRTGQTPFVRMHGYFIWGLIFVMLFFWLFVAKNKRLDS